MACRQYYTPLIAAIIANRIHGICGGYQSTLIYLVSISNPRKNNLKAAVRSPVRSILEICQPAKHGMIAGAMPVYNRQAI